jgi:hypothetical protein
LTLKVASESCELSLAPDGSREAGLAVVGSPLAQGGFGT